LICISKERSVCAPFAAAVTALITRRDTSPLIPAAGTIEKGNKREKYIKKKKKEKKRE
jgi:hypothetical protein